MGALLKLGPSRLMLVGSNFKRGGRVLGSK